MRHHLLAFAPLLLLLAACGPGETGDACTSDKDCPTMCQTGGGFPGGICTLECEMDSECPTGFVCISDSSGICMPTCTDDQSCTDARGAGWECREKSKQSGGGTANVCYGN